MKEKGERRMWREKEREERECKVGKIGKKGRRKREVMVEERWRERERGKDEKGERERNIEMSVVK